MNTASASPMNQIMEPLSHWLRKLSQSDSTLEGHCEYTLQATDVQGAESSLSLQWIPSPADFSAGCVLLTENGESLLFNPTINAEPDADDAPFWNEYPAASWLFAWTLQHEELLKRIEKIIGTRLHPQRMIAESSDLKGQRTEIFHLIFFRWKLSTPKGPSSGWMGLSNAMLEHLNSIRKHPSNHHPNIIKNVDTAEIVLRITPIKAHDLSAFFTGDILLTGVSNGSSLEYRLRCRNAEILFPLKRIDDMEFTILDPLEKHQITEKTSGNLICLEDIPVELDLLLGSRSISCTELSRLAPGQVLRFPHQIDDMTATLLVNGRPFADGNLLSIGGQLGFQFVRIAENES